MATYTGRNFALTKNGNTYVFNPDKLVTGTGTAGQAGSSSAAYIPSLWTFNLGMTPNEGDHISIKIPIAGVNSGIWMSVDNGTTYYPVAVNGTTRLTTQYTVDHIIELVYQTGMTTAMYGTTKDGAAAGSSTSSVSLNRWCVLNYYDSNTTYTNAALGHGYATCTTAESTVAKKATLSSYALTTGGYVSVKFTYAVPANSTLSVNSKTAKPIYYKGAAIISGIIKAGDLAVFLYNGSQYHLMAIDRAACESIDPTPISNNEIDALFV